MTKQGFTILLLLLLLLLHLNLEVVAKERESKHHYKRRPPWFPQVNCQKFWKGKMLKPGRPRDVNNRQHCFKEWALLIYMAADNDLSPYAHLDIHEMEREVKGALNLGASTAKVDVLVELDTFGSSDGIQRLQIFQGKKKYNMSSSLPQNLDIESPIVQWLPEGGSEGDVPHRFENFLRWGLRNYPAKNTMVILWGHGEGFIGDQEENPFLPTFDISSKQGKEGLFLIKEEVNPGFDLPTPTIFPLDKVFGGIAFDNSDSSYLNLPSLNEILGKVSSELLAHEPIDIFAMDACLMQSVEVATELADHTLFIVGSTQIQNYLGLPYRTLIDQINTGPTVYDLARSIPEMVERSWSQGGLQHNGDKTGFETFTVSTLSSWALKNALLPQLDRLGMAMRHYIEEKKYRRHEISFILEASPSFRGETRDLGIFLGILEKLIYEEIQKGKGTTIGHWLRREIQNTHRQIMQVMISYAYGPTYYQSKGPSKYLLGYFKGLSIWLPSQRDFYDYRKEEMKSSLYFNYGEQNWSFWLEEQFKPYRVHLPLKMSKLNAPK